MAVIFDMDGTLADCEHRRHHVLGEDKNWAAWNAEMGSDTPNEPVVRLLKILRDRGAVIVTTGRQEKHRRVTDAWLAFNGIEIDDMYMRADDDMRADHLVKAEMLVQIRADGWEPWLVVDDRNSVVEMWRAQGLTCLQCAPGDF